MHRFIVLLVVVAAWCPAAGCGGCPTDRVNHGYPNYDAVKSRMAPEQVEPVVDTEGEPFNTETYDHIVENPFLAANTNPLSTFSVDVNTASYAIVRRFLSQR